MEDPKQLIVSLLNGHIEVYDDAGALVPVSVSAAWPQIAMTFPYVSVGPELGTHDDPEGLGAIKFKSEGVYQIDIWCKLPPANNYSTDRLLFDIRQEIKRLVKASMFNPDPSIQYVLPTFWHETFDETLLANRLTGQISVIYREDRLISGSKRKPESPFILQDLLSFSEEYGIIPMITHEGFLYVGTWTTPGQITKIDLSTFTKVSTLTLSTATHLGFLAVKDGFLYASCESFPTGALVKVDLATFTEVATLTFDDISYLENIVFDDNYLYATSRMAQPGIILRVNLSTFTRDSVLTFNTGEDYSQSLNIKNGFLYAGCNTSPIQIVKVDTSTFTEVSTLTLGDGEEYLDGNTSIIIGNNLYVGCYSTPAMLVQVDLASFTEIATLDFGTNSSYITTMTSDNYGFLYLGLVIYNTYPMLAQVDPSTMSIIGYVLPLPNYTGGNIYGLVVDSDCFYAANYDLTPGVISKGPTVISS